jgi:hypothetical protein
MTTTDVGATGWTTIWAASVGGGEFCSWVGAFNSAGTSALLAFPSPTPTPTLPPAPAKLQPPPAPTGVAYSQESVDDPQQVISGHDTVSWNAAGEPPGTTITVAGTLRCLAPEGSPEGTSCLALHTSFAASDLVILGVVPADVGQVTWDVAYGIGPGCFGMSTTLTQEIYALVVWANNDAGQSRAIIAGTPATVVGWGATC